MPPGDPTDRASRAQRSDRPKPPAAASSEPGTPAETPRTPGDKEGVDFGSYVSSTVRSAAELFGTPARSAPARRRPPSEPSTRSTPRSTFIPSPRATTSTHAEPGDVAEPRTRERPSRYWRDSLAPAGAESEPYEEDDDGGAGGPVFPWAFRDGERPGRNVIIAAVLLALLLVIALIWFFTRGGDGDDDNLQAPPATTTESVIDTDATESPDDGTPPPFIPPDDATEAGDEPTPSPTPRRGGDNQRDNPDEETPEGGTGGGVDLNSIAPGPIASQCSDRCLVRVAANDDLGALLANAQTRPSFSAEDWTWVVASTPGIALLEQNTETVLVADSPDTLSLYVVQVPPEETTDDRLAQVGTVVDSVGPFRLLSAAQVPTNVRPLTDWGYEVHKLPPGPPTEVVTPEEPLSLANVEIGALIDDVSASTIESDIETLQAMGSGSSDGLGTRHYTTRGNMETAEFLYQRLESYGLRVWYEDFLSWQGYLMVNVLAEIPGEDDSAIYGVMAHFDTIAKDVTVAPGADDNATGVAGSLEIARILSGYQLKHPVHIVFVNVEEEGIVGSQHFARNAKEQGVPYEGIFNLDSIGAQRQYAYMVVNGDASTAWMSDLFREINEAYGLGQVINVQQNEAIVADDNRLREHGIDSLMVARELYGSSPTHHTSGDVISTVSINGVVSCTQLTLLSLASLVQG